MKVLRRYFFLAAVIYLSGIVLMTFQRRSVSPIQLSDYTDPVLAAIFNTFTPSIQEALPIVGAENGEQLVYASLPGASKDLKESPSNLILMWAGPGDVDQKNLNGCPDFGCVITHDHRLINRSSAIVFMHGATDRPRIRHPWQYYVFFTQESPVHIRVLQPHKHFFNLTLSYRRDSDAPSPYGYSVKRLKPRTDWKEGLKNVIRGKEKLVAWFVSNCDAPSQRDAYVHELRKWIPVDVYGSCGNLTCSRTYEAPARENPSGWSYDQNEDDDFETDKDNCDRMLERDYKFYLAFENSICKDYITEKFWHKLTLRIVPIVLKRSIVEQYAPPGSFIAVDDFRSPRQLAAFLKELSSDPVAYERRFDWRINYRTVFLNGHDHDARERPWGFCTLCSIITQNRTVRRNSYEDMTQWWEKEADCDNNLVKRLLESEQNATRKSRRKLMKQSYR